MSSDYIPRLRSELLRAGARRQARLPWMRVASGLRPLAVAAAVALIAVAALTRRGVLWFYDCERSVPGPGGAPAPADKAVTGGPDAGRGGRSAWDRRASGPPRAAGGDRPDRAECAGRLVRARRRARPDPA